MKIKVHRMLLSIVIFSLFACVSFGGELQQNANTVLLVSPDYFGFNAETAESNSFQNKDNGSDSQEAALDESKKMVADLNAAGVKTIVLPSRTDIATPDAVFPNNWFSVHSTADGKRTLVLYPMLAPNRRAERQVELLTTELESAGFEVSATVDLSGWEDKGKYLEGTGSLVLDRVNGVAFAVLSPRTDPDVLDDFEKQLGYTTVRFHSVDKNGKPVYHTNVVMSMAQEFAVICLESIEDQNERNNLVEVLKKQGKEIVPISLEQMYHMCGNVIELEAEDGGKVLLMSETAFNNFTPEQKSVFEKYCTILPVSIPTIERIGGGSARCMVGEVF